MIVFNRTACIGTESKYINEAIQSSRVSGDGIFTDKCSRWIENNLGIHKTLLTTSCTHALEIAALLCNIEVGDEVIMPSYTFVSTANAFVLRGAKIKFIDIHKNTMNINEQLIEEAITHKTKAIVPVHYAGVGCEMDTIMEISKKHNLMVIEDAAQGVKGSYKGKSLGSIGHIGCYSFHETKNYTMGEGGALLLNDPTYIELAEVIREKGTDRSKFFRGQIDKYSWISIGSSYLPSDINAAYLYAQLEMAEEINNNRLKSWNLYNQYLEELELKGYIDRPYIPNGCEHNAHMYYIKVKDLDTRTRLIKYLKDRNINTFFHYVPLHSSKAGLKYGEFIGEDRYTTKESERLLRLPLYYGLNEDDLYLVVKCIKNFFFGN